MAKQKGGGRGVAANIMMLCFFNLTLLFAKWNLSLKIDAMASDRYAMHTILKTSFNLLVTLR